MSERRERIMSLLTEMAATFVQHEANTDPLITITRTDISPDSKNATIFFTTLPEGKEEQALIFLTRYAGELRRHIKKASNIKIIPHIDFVLDYGERHRQHIDDITRDIKK